MKIWIVYDSKFGNNKQIADSLAGLLDEGNEVHVHHAKTVKPKEAIDADMLLFGGPLRAGLISFTIKGWVTRYSKILKAKNAKLAKVAAWCTHGKSGPDTPPRFAWNTIALKWNALINGVPATNALSDVESIIVEGMEGPLESGWKDIVAGFAERIKAQ